MARKYTGPEKAAILLMTLGEEIGDCPNRSWKLLSDSFA